jgi:hypothetical protein
MKQTIWNPANVQEAINMASLLANNDQRKTHELIILHAAFGHHFDGELGMLSEQGSVIQGKPTLGADPMAGIVRRSGLCRYIQVTSWDATHCTLKTARTDEPEEVVHEFTFTIEMANQMGLTQRGHTWKKMPMQMLRSRVVTMALRAVFPDAVSGIYGADEIAENSNLSDQERERVVAQAIGEAPPTQPPAAPQQPPQQQQQIEPNRLYDFSTEEGWQKALKGWGLSLDDAVDLVAHMVDSPTTLTPSQKEELFYSRLACTSMRNASIPTDWFTGTMDEVRTYHQNLSKQFKILTYMLPRFFGPRMACGAWMETLKLAQAIQMRERQDKAVQVLKDMYPLDWTAYDFVQSLLDEDMELGSH